MKVTKRNIKKVIDNLSSHEALMYRCWKKNILHETSVMDMAGDEVKQIIKLEGTKITSMGYNLSWG